MHQKHYQPSADLAHFVEHYWIIRWDIAATPVMEIEVAPSPGVSITITSAAAEIAGLKTNGFTRNFSGNGVALGVTFKPGGFYPFFKKPLDRLTNQVAPLSNIFSSTRIKKITTELDQPDQALIAALEKLLRSKRPQEDPNIDAIEVILKRIQEDDQLATVQDVCEAYCMSERTLQRTFQHYVGIGLKWLIGHYRSQGKAKAA